ncbi:16463_t:CDS:2, partial [Acaulospora colombiana]
DLDLTAADVLTSRDGLWNGKGQGGEVIVGERERVKCRSPLCNSLQASKSHEQVPYKLAPTYLNQTDPEPSNELSVRSLRYGSKEGTVTYTTSSSDCDDASRGCTIITAYSSAGYICYGGVVRGLAYSSRVPIDLDVLDGLILVYAALIPSRIIHTMRTHLARQYSEGGPVPGIKPNLPDP